MRIIRRHHGQSEGPRLMIRCAFARSKGLKCGKGSSMQLTGKKGWVEGFWMREHD